MASFIRLLVCSSRHLLSQGRSCSAVGLETGRPGPRSAPRLPAAPSIPPPGMALVPLGRVSDDVKGSLEFPKEFLLFSLDPYNPFKRPAKHAAGSRRLRR